MLETNCADRTLGIKYGFDSSTEEINLDEHRSHQARLAWEIPSNVPAHNSIIRSGGKLASAYDLMLILVTRQCHMRVPWAS